MNATELLKADHAVVRRLFDEYRNDRARDVDKKRIFGQILHELELHAAIEDEILHPALLEKRASARGERQRTVDSRIESLLSTLSNLEPNARDFDSHISSLAEHFERHVAEEETGTFPEAEWVLSRSELADLGALIEAARARRNEGAKR